jgi:hypothetical protein
MKYIPRPYADQEGLDHNMINDKIEANEVKIGQSQ